METSKRKLAAIVFTDIVGFTELAGRDQSKASALLAKQRERFRPIVDKYNGKWIKEIGDGLLLIFDTVLDSVNCCVQLQKESNSIDDLNIRIGIHQGEILTEEKDVIGDDVNIAARIEPFAASGGIAISNKVNDAVVREKEFETKYLGKPKLKGVAQEVKVFCITSHNLPETILSDVSAKLESESKNNFQWNIFSLTGALLSIIGILFWLNISFLGIGIASVDKIPSVSILVPDNLGDEINSKWMNFLTENIIIDIANLGNIVVTPLRNVIKISKEDYTTDDIVEQLDTDYMLLSSVYVDGKEFDINSQLIETKSNKSVFGKKISDKIKNIPEVSGEIAKEILLKIGLKANEELAAKGKQERFNEAYNNHDYEKAYDIVKPASRKQGLIINISGDFSYNRILGTINDDLYNLLEEKILPKIKTSPYDISIDIHSSNKPLPDNSIFKNNLDMTVAVAKNLEIFFNNLKLEKNIHVYGIGDMMPKGLFDLMSQTPSWNMSMLTSDIIKGLNIDEEQIQDNNRITITFLNPK